MVHSEPWWEDMSDYLVSCRHVIFSPEEGGAADPWALLVLRTGACILCSVSPRNQTPLPVRDIEHQLALNMGQGVGGVVPQLYPLNNLVLGRVFDKRAVLGPSYGA